MFQFVSEQSQPRARVKGPEVTNIYISIKIQNHNEMNTFEKIVSTCSIAHYAYI